MLLFIRVMLILVISAASVFADTQVYFNSNSQWPPMILNNDGNMQSDTFYAIAWSTCQNGIDPKQSTLAVIQDPGNYTGLTIQPVTAFSCSDADFRDVDPPSFIQLDDDYKKIGIWLNSVGRAGGPDLYIETLTPAIQFWPGKTPWMDPTGKLRVSFYASLNKYSFQPDNSAVPYLISYIMLRHHSSNEYIWFGTIVADHRGCNEGVFGNDNWGDGVDDTGWPIVHSCLNAEATFITPLAGTTRTSQFPEELFVYDITRDNLRSLLAAYNSWAGARNKPQWATDDNSLSQYQVVNWVFSPEVADSNAGRTTTLEINPASMFNRTVTVDIWIRRSVSAGWQWARAFDLPGPWGWAPVTVDMSDAEEFRGQLTAMAFNPRVAETNGGRIGFSYFKLINDSANVTRAWTLDSLPNPLPMQFWSSQDSSLYSLFWYSNLWTDTLSWAGDMSPAVQPSFQITDFMPVELEAAATIGVTVRDIRISQFDRNRSKR